MSKRLNLLPDPLFADLKVRLEERLAQVGASVQPSNFSSLLDPMMERVLEQGFAEAGAHEGTVWLVNSAGKSLVPAYNTGPNADRMVGKFEQPLNSGLVCMVLASEQPFVENEVYKNSQQSKLLDNLLRVQTHALMVVPFYFLQACRGVVSCVQLKTSVSEADPPGFDPVHLATLQRAAGILSRLIEFRLLSQTVGWTDG